MGGGLDTVTLVVGLLHFNKDFWEYDPVTNVWTQIADFGGNERGCGVSFSIGNKGYAGLDEAPMAYKDINIVMAAQNELVDVLAKFTPKMVRMADDGSRED